MSNAYVGIDVNLSGYGLAILTDKEITLRFIPFIRKDKLDEAMPKYIQAAFELLKLVANKCAAYDLIAAIEDPTSMAAPKIMKKKNRIVKVTSLWQVASTLDKLVGILAYALSIPILFNSTRVIYPSSVIWKKAIVGDAWAKKEKVARVASVRLLGKEMIGYFEGNHHISDSVALAMYAEKYHKGELDGTTR